MNKSLKTRQCPITQCEFNHGGLCLTPGTVKHCLTRKMGAGKTRRETEEKWRKYAWRGHTVANFCPGCFKLLLTVEEAQKIGEYFAKGEFNEMRAIFSKRTAIFGIYVPGREDIAQLLSHRAIIHPRCSHCSQHIGEPWFENLVERNIVLGLRYLPRLKQQREGV